MERVMKQTRISRLCNAMLILVLSGVMLTGCTSISQATATAVGKSAGSVYTSKTLTTSYTGALDASNQLVLGMLKLEGTDNAVTAEQAQSMLRVMQALQGQVLKADDERNAVWANVEAQLTPAQVAAIVAMHLTQDDLQTWTRDTSQGPGAGPGQGGVGPQGTPGAMPGQGGVRPQGTPGAMPGQGGVRPQGTPGAMPGQGGVRPQGTPGAMPGQGNAGVASGQSNVLLNALIRLLATKSAGVAAPTPTKP
jgi:hypothetical protein